MTDRETLLKKIDTYSFALLDLNLYLDTHPYDKQIHSQVKSYQEILQPLKNEYEAKYGPLTKTNTSNNHWAWVNSPWPWEPEDN